jgi:glutamate--cysteine ligase
MSREAKTGVARPITDKKDLLTIFQEGARPPNEYLLGLEIELVGVDEEGKTIPFEGGRGVHQILKSLSVKFGWEEVRNGDWTIGLSRGDSAITIEPGGQLELSSRPHSDLYAMRKELSGFIHELLTVSSPLGVRWISVGLSPLTPLESVSWVPKFRYDIMKKYYSSRPGTPLQMMGMTASIQVNLDYSGEEDARRKIHLGAALGPVVGAIFANSAVERGKLNGYASRRLKIWRHTDPDRCGIRPFFVDGSFSFEKYADYALDVPMYFVLRDGKYVDRTNFSFRKFMETGEATFSDWSTHLTTLFPDVRLKDHLEFRTADENHPDLMLALVAFWIGLLHDSDSIGSALSRVAHFTLPQIKGAMDSAAIHGLSARIVDEPILRVARDVVEMSVLGLSRLDRRTGQSNLKMLDPVREIVELGRSPGEQTRKSFRSFKKFLEFNELHPINAH